MIVCAKTGFSLFTSGQTAIRAQTLTTAESDSLILPDSDGMSGFRVWFDPNELQGIRV